MTDHPHWAPELRAAAGIVATLMLAGLSIWHYLVGDYRLIALPAAVACLLLITTLSTLRRPTRTMDYLLLVCGYLVTFMQLPTLDDFHTLWLCALVVFNLMLLPLSPLLTLALNLVLMPAWIVRLEGSFAAWNHTQPYLTMVAIVALCGWEFQRQRALARATDPNDPDCDAVNHHTLHERLEGEVDRARHLEQGLVVLILHLPQLDITSEQFGPRAQLSQLDLLCRAVRSRCRDHDILGRQNHADFWLVLPNTSESGALLVLKRLEQMLDNIRLTDTIPVTLCSCLCTLRPGETWPDFEQRLEKSTFDLNISCHSGTQALTPSS
ncbi:diguanylate cyclase domain-containing protein [Halomonas binhaiensis]|nr:diguanylate cyclase [Halomonas binhaiensis]